MTPDDPHSHDENTPHSPYLDAVHRRLAEQLRFTAYEIEDRKRLLQIEDKDTELLRRCRFIVNAEIDAIVEEFYEQQLQTAQIALIIGDAETLHRLKAAMRGYILDLFEGVLDLEYVDKRLRIGKVHQRIGVEPKLYVSTIRMLHMVVRKRIAKVEFDSETDRQRTADALDKILMFDLQLVFDTYISSLLAQVEATKNEVERYAASLERQVAERTRQVSELSMQDALTGLANRKSFWDHIQREASAAARTKQPYSLAFIDLNGFKKVNDEQGHFTGDKLLSDFAGLLRDCMRGSDIACRYGGDEFCVVMPRSNLAAATIGCNRLMQMRDDRAKDLPITLSIGLIEVDDPSIGVDEVVKRADALMYVAKRRSKESHGHELEAATVNATNLVVLDAHGGKADDAPDAGANAGAPEPDAADNAPPAASAGGDA